MFFKIQSDQPRITRNALKKPNFRSMNFKVHQDAHIRISFYFIFLKTVGWKRILRLL